MSIGISGSSLGYSRQAADARFISSNPSLAKTTIVDADETIIRDSEVAGTPAKRLTFANLWTWNKAKIDAVTSFVIASNATFSYGNATASNNHLTALGGSAVGQNVFKAVDAPAARTTLGLGNAALATTSTGGNGSADSGKVLAFGSDGSIKTTKVTVQSSAGLTGLVLNPPTSSFAAPTFVAGSYTVATTQSAFGIPDNIAPPLDKTTPVDADGTIILDSANSSVAKRLTFANLWTWITTKLGGNLTIAGNKTLTGQLELSASQAATNPESAMNRILTDRRDIESNWRPWGISHFAPSGCLVIDSGNTANAVQVANYTSTNYPLPILSCEGDSRTAMSFDRRHIVSMHFYASNLSGGGVGWIVCGESYNTNSVADPAKKSFGIRLTSNGVALWVHNGVALAVGAPTAFSGLDQLHKLIFEYYGGTITGSVNGVALASVSGGPSGAGDSNNTAVSFQAKTGATNERCRYGVMFAKSLTTTN